MPGFRGRDTTFLAVASALSGLLAYAFFSVVTRTLGAAPAAPVAVLWTYWSASAAVLTFPIQHWIARTVAAEGGEAGIRRALPRVSALVVLGAALAGAAAWLVRDQLFHSDGWVFPLLIALVTVGSGFIGVIRGQLSARHRFHAVGAALIGENAVRCVAAGALATAGVSAPGAYGLALGLGPLIGLAWPSCLRLASSGVASAATSSIAFLSGIASGSLLSQLVLTGGPVVLSLLGGAPSEVTALFATLALFRAPYTLSIGVVSQVTGYLTALAHQGRQDILRRLRRALALGAVAGAALGFALGWLIGPTLVTTVFGSGVDLPPLETGLAAAGSAVAVANLLAILGLVARGRGGAVLRSWVVGSIVGASVLLLDLDLVTCVLVAFVTAEAVAFVAMAVHESRTATETIATEGRRRPKPV